MQHKHFRDLADVVPKESLMVVNDSRVIQARISAVKETGGKAEVLLLRPRRGKAPALALSAPCTEM